MGPSRYGSVRFAWKKFAIGVMCIITVVYIFGPRERRDLGWGKLKNAGE